MFSTTCFCQCMYDPHYLDSTNKPSFPRFRATAIHCMGNEFELKKMLAISCRSNRRLDTEWTKWIGQVNGCDGDGRWKRYVTFHFWRMSERTTICANSPSSSRLGKPGFSIQAFSTHKCAFKRICHSRNLSIFILCKFQKD